jgi:hypothetical protein
MTTPAIEDFDIRDVEALQLIINGSAHSMAEHIIKLGDALREATTAYQRLRDFAVAVLENDDTPLDIAAQASAALGTTPVIPTKQHT